MNAHVKTILTLIVVFGFIVLTAWKPVILAWTGLTLIVGIFYLVIHGFYSEWGDDTHHG